MNPRNLPTVVLGAIAAVGLLAAVAIYAMTNANLFADYNLTTGRYEGGPSAVVALIPLAIGVAAGIGAIILWGVSRQAAHSK